MPPVKNAGLQCREQALQIGIFDVNFSKKIKKQYVRIEKDTVAGNEIQKKGRHESDFWFMAPFLRLIFYKKR